MIYIISGVSRSGKSILAKRLAKERQISLLPVDSLMMGFMEAFPESGIHHELWPNEIAKKIWHFVETMIDYMILNGMDYIFEGEAFLPEDIHNLQMKYPNLIKACFMGYKDMDVKDKVAMVKGYPSHANDWLVTKEEAYIIDHIGNMVDYSRFIYQECTEHNIQYFEVGMEFNPSLNRIMDFFHELKEEVKKPTP